jgi:hypothetical protein
MTRYGIILHPSLCVLRASFSCVPKKAATEIRDKIKHSDFFTTRFAGVHGVHGDKSFVFAHVFLQEVTEATEKLCGDYDYDYDAYGISSVFGLPPRLAYISKNLRALCAFVRVSLVFQRRRQPRIACIVYLGKTL